MKTDLTHLDEVTQQTRLQSLLPSVSLSVTIESDVDACRALWERFSPNKSVFDQWDYRMAWLNAYKFPLYFYTLYANSEVVGLLPLWYNGDEKIYEWMCGYWAEDQRMFATDPRYVPILGYLAPTPLRLYAMRPFENMQALSAFGEFAEDTDPKYVKDIISLHSMDEYLATLKKKNRYNLKADYQRIMDQNPTVSFLKASAHLKDFETMVSMNIKRREETGIDTSEFLNAKELAAFRNIASYAESYSCVLIKVVINNTIAAIDMVIECASTYYLFRGGNDTQRFGGIGNFMTFIEIEDAIKKNFRLIDCLQEDMGWKHRFFDTKTVYSFEKKLSS
ncbi:hypothetical protein HYS00_01345 [Candidatus Microgenomates bacterium]|nr:hypothetical protein [Candidatus Microgenomates bacterium]